MRFNSSTTNNNNNNNNSKQPTNFKSVSLRLLLTANEYNFYVLMFLSMRMEGFCNSAA